MKKGRFIFAALLGCAVLTGSVNGEEWNTDQSEDVREIDAITTNEDGTSEHTYSKYDEEGRLVMKLSVRADGTFSGYELYQYHETETYRMIYQEDGTLDTAICYCRDENGNLMEEFRESEYICSLKKYTYENDRLQSMVELNLNSDGEVSGTDHITEYTYENGTLINETLYLVLRGKKNELMRTEYTYENGMLVKKQDAYTVTEYTYENGMLISDLSKDEELGSRESHEYTYDAEGNLTEMVYHYETADVDVTYETEYLYAELASDNTEIEFPEYAISDAEREAVREKMDMLEAVELAEVVIEEESEEASPEDIETIDADKELIQSVQETLNANGFDCGKADGLMGSRTSNAINSYQAQNGLTVTGTINRELLNHLGL